MWIILILYASVSFAVVLEDEESCMAVMQLNAPYWQASGQHPQAVCMKTYDI